MEFKCDFCDFETDDEDQILYCDCGRTTCMKHYHTIYHQGFDDEMCPVCYQAYKMERNPL